MRQQFVHYMALLTGNSATIIANESSNLKGLPTRDCPYTCLCFHALLTALFLSWSFTSLTDTLWALFN